MALGAVLVIAALIGGFVLLVGGDDDDDADRATPGGSGLSKRLTKADAGLSVFHPEDWRRAERSGIVNLESPDRCVVVSLSAPVAAALSDRLFADSVEGLRQASRGTQLARPRRTPVVGDAPTRTAILTLRNKQGTPVTVRLSVSRGKQLAHVLQVVTRAPNCEESVQRSGAIIDSIEYTR